MNKKLHRVVFNQRRGQLMAAAETASSQGKAASGDANGPAAKLADIAGVVLRPLRFALLCALGPVFATGAFAQIKADASAPGNQRPTILSTAGGLPQVDIQTPSAAGVSRNVYSQFDVQAQGAVLNNSRTNVQTQLGGWVSANPWLAAGSARVILNEVNSSNPSYLKGYVEVAGQKAEVIIANPAGIQVGGGGFLNASSVTLTTGTPVMNSGNLESYRVSGGRIQVEGLGLDTRTASVTQILTRAAEINAGLWANYLKIVTGANLVSAAEPTGEATGNKPVPIAANPNEAKPRFALDVAAIGGMYAGHIYLIGTDKGLGVNTQGSLYASSGDLVLLANGWLSNSGEIKAAGNASLSASGTAPATASPNGSLGASTLNNTNGKIEHAGIGTLDIRATTLNDQRGHITSTGALSVTADAIDHNGAITQAASVGITAASLNNQAGQILQTGSGSANTQLSISGALDNTGGTIAGNGDATISAQSLNNQGDLIKTTGTSDLTLATTGLLDNSKGGRIQAGGNASLKTSTRGSVNNDGGAIKVGAQLSIQTSGQLSNRQGVVTSNAALTLSTGSADNTDGVIASVQSSLGLTSSGTLDNTHGLVTAATSASVHDTASTKTLTITNTGGTLSASQSASVAAASLGGDGKLLSAGDLSVSLNSDFSNSGEVTANGNARIATTGKLTNSGTLQAGATLEVTAANLDNTATGQILAVNNRITVSDTLSIAAATLSNEAETVAGTTKAAVIAARERLDIGAGNLTKGQDALIYSAGDMAIGGSLDANRRATGSAQTIANAGGTIEAAGALSASAAQISNTNPNFAYTIQSAGSTAGKEYITASGTYTAAQVAWVLAENTYGGAGAGGGTSCGGSQGRLLPAGHAYADRKYQPYYNSADAFVAAHRATVANAEGFADTIYVGDSFAYTAADPVWAVFNVAPPAGANPGPRPTPICNDIGCSNPTPAELATWDAAAAPWVALQAKLDTLRSAVNASAVTFTSFRDYSQDSQQAVVQTSTPGKILSGAAMTLNASTSLLNEQSQIVAGGTLTVSSQAIDNRALAISANTKRNGTQYNWAHFDHGCGNLKGCDYNYNAYQASSYTQDIPQNLSLNTASSRANTAPSGLGLGSGTRLSNAGAAGSAIVQVVSAVASANGLSGSAPVIRTVTPATSLPNTRLFQVSPNPAANYLVETDPRFTSYKNWLSSDYMLSALAIDPATTHKRLGDGFYEQRLVREQVAQLAGRRFLGDFTSDEQQYKALMNSGLTYAQEFNLRPGIALSAAQVAQLTSDMVWLVEQEVTLPDGSTQKALVPQVYAVVRAGGDLGKTLEQLGSSESIKGLLTAMATAGAIQALNPGSVPTSTGQSGTGAQTVSTTQAANDFLGNLQRNITNNLAGAVIDSAINGKPLNETTLSSALTSALVTAGMAQGANSIGDLKDNKSLNSYTQAVAHAVLGCVAGAASTSGGCGAGALCGVVGELTAAYAKEAGISDKNALALAKTLSAAAGVMAGGGGTGVAAVNVAAQTGANAAMYNRMLHPTETQKARELAAQSGGKYTAAQIEEQMRLMGNTAYGVPANKTEVLTTTQAIVNNITQDPSMPKATDGKTVVEVAGQANVEIQQFIMANTKDGAGYIPGQSPYIASNAALNKPVTTNTAGDTTTTATCANGDMACKSGVGVQQNAPLTQQTKEAIADGAASVSRQAGVIAAGATAATAAAPPQVKPITGAVATGATVMGVAADVVEQVIRPNTGQTTVNTLGTVANEAANRVLPIAAPLTNEAIEALKSTDKAKEIESSTNSYLENFAK